MEGEGMCSALALLFCSHRLFPLSHVTDARRGCPSLVPYRAAWVTAVPRDSVLWFGGGLLNPAAAVHKFVLSGWVYLPPCARQWSLQYLAYWAVAGQKMEGTVLEVRSCLIVEFTSLLDFPPNHVLGEEKNHNSVTSGFLFCFCNGRKVLSTSDLFMTVKR